MLKLAGMFFLIIGGAGIGYARSLELTRSQKNLESLLQLLLLLKGEIRCANSTLPDAFREIADKIRDPFGHILREAAEVMEKADGQTPGRNHVYLWRKRARRKKPGQEEKRLKSLEALDAGLDIWIKKCRSAR